MDFSKTKIYQRTRSGYDKLYLEYNEKKQTGRRRNPPGGSGGGSINESGEDRINKVGESSGKSSDRLKKRDEIDTRSRKIRKGRKKLGKARKMDKNAKPVCLIVESEDDDDGAGLHEPSPENHSEFVIEETSGSGKGGEKKSQRADSLDECNNTSPYNFIDELEEASGHGFDDKEDSVELSKSSDKNQSKSDDEAISGSGKTNKNFGKGFPVSPRVFLGENHDNKSTRTNDSPDKSDDDDALSLSHDNDGSGKIEKNSEEGFMSDIPASIDNCSKGKKVSSIGCLVDESDDHDGITLGDDVTCMDDCDPSHSSRVGSNELKFSPVHDLNTSEDDDNGDGKDHEVISVSSSSSSSSSSDDDEESSVHEVDNKIGDTGDEFWTEVVKKGPFNEPVSKKRRTEKPNLKKQDSVQGDNEEPYWVEDYKGWEKRIQHIGKTTVKKPNGTVNDVIKILTETIKEGENGDELLKQYVTVTEEDTPSQHTPSQETFVEKVLSYKFKFEEDDDDMKMKPDESERDKEVDGLFDEMNMCFQLSEMGSCGPSVVNNHGGVNFLTENIDQATLCRLGKHKLTINDQFGIICRYCSYVEIEVRDILPPLSKNGRGGHGRHDLDTDRQDNLNFSNLNWADSRHNHEEYDNHKESEYEKGTVWDLVPGVKETLYPHQREGFEFIWQKIAGGTHIEKLGKRLPNGGSGCIISHAPGTGKSRLTIVFLQSFMRKYPDSRPLIIAPRCMLLTWEEEFKKWKCDVPFYNLNNKEYSGEEDKMASTLLKQNGNGKSARCLRLVKLYSWKRKSSVLGITYRLFESLVGEEGKRKKNATVKNPEDVDIKNFLLQVPTLLVLDEGHTPRNEESLMWKALLNVKTKRSIILSGTPFQNNFNELYNTFCLVNPMLPYEMSSMKTDNFTNKRGRKNNSAKGQWDSITSEVLKSRHKLDELRAMIDPFVHVHKGTILQEMLPGLRDALVVLKPTKTQKTLLGKISGTKSQVENDHVMSLVSIHPSLVQKHFVDNEGFYKLLKMYERDPRAGGKTNFLMELIKLSVALNERVLVFSQYTKPLRFIMELLEDKFNWIRDREFLYMDGQQEEKNRQTSINTLNDPKSEVKILLASIRACSEGINLVGASRVVLLDVQWNPSVERQAISRAYRLGQKKMVYVYHLVTGTMEGGKYIRQVEKSHLSELVFSSKNKASAKNKLASMVSGDKILEEMVQHDKLQHMFEKVIYQPKEADLVKTFG